MKFISHPAIGGLLLIAATLLALVAANSSIAPIYTNLLDTQFLNHNLTYWVNDALMALFFLFVGIELKRELLTGHLSTWSQRTLPGACALGGMIIPAIIYLFINQDSPSTLQGWAIPTATDIAFALGILALIPRIPSSLKVFLTALAIIDDLGAILLIALFYTSDLNLPFLFLSMILTAALYTFNKCYVKSLWPYLTTGALLWLCVYQSGLHATMSGVILALTLPLKPGAKIEHAIAPIITAIILPLFAFCNAGIPLAGITLASLKNPVTLGIFLGLFIGKQLGVGGALVIAQKAFHIRTPHGSSTAQLYAVTLLCGIGFTMSLFIGNLAFPSLHENEVRIGIMLASAISATLALNLLILSSRQTK